MYITFSFIGISQTLPSTSYIKMIDLWMIFTMICPFSEILLVWLSDLFQRNVVSRQGWLKKKYLRCQNSDSVSQFLSL